MEGNDRTREFLADIAMLASGIFLFLMPWLFGFAAIPVPAGSAWVSGVVVIALAFAELAAFAALLNWAHRDPFDRLLAASAMRYGLPIISADTVFDELGDNDNWRSRLW